MKKYSWKKYSRIKSGLVFIFCFITHLSNAQELNTLQNDTIKFNGFIGINYSQDYQIKFNSEKYQLRFKSDKNTVLEAEKQFKIQYIEATRKEIKREFEEAARDSTSYNWKVYLKQNEGHEEKVIANAKLEIKQDYTKYDRRYYGIYLKSEKYILIEFLPHKIKYFEAGGEGHIKSFPLLLFKTKTKTLYYAGAEN